MGGKGGLGWVRPGGALSRLLAAAVVLGGVAQAARAEDACAAPGSGRDRAVADYTPVFQRCSRAGEQKLALRAMAIGGARVLLLADPEDLSTSLERQACWSCTPTTDEAEGSTRLVQEARRAWRAGGAPLGTARVNAGVTGGAGSGIVVTADLCPSHKPLDRPILERLAARQPHAPIGLAVTGAWLRTHREDVDWLRARAAAGDLAITWINHTDRHRYVPGLRPDANFLLLPGTDLASEVLGGERQIVEAGETPSVFFRFPGLVSTPALGRDVASLHLVTLGAAAWLATGHVPRPGDVALVHANGNEPAALRVLAKLLESGQHVFPLRPAADARAPAEDGAGEPAVPVPTGPARTQ